MVCSVQSSDQRHLHYSLLQGLIKRKPLPSTSTHKLFFLQISLCGGHRRLKVTFLSDHFGRFLKINEALTCWFYKPASNTFNGAEASGAGDKHTFINQDNYICPGERLSRGQRVVSVLLLFGTLTPAAVLQRHRGVISQTVALKLNDSNPRLFFLKCKNSSLSFLRAHRTDVSS